ncbi:MAG: hypothetical protein IPK97_01095 [Ahniella sp.]|nr:hypothetical protein [Ahniella sp.]
MAPIDCTGCLSNTGWNVVVPSVDFHTPPLAAPTSTTVLPFSLYASSALDATAHLRRTNIANAEPIDG